MKAWFVTLPVKMMACGLESCAGVCVIRVRWLVRMAKNVSTMSRQAERSLLIRTVRVRHESNNVIALGFSHRMFVHWRAVLLLTTSKAPLSYPRGEVGRQLGLCPILAPASWVSGRGGGSWGSSPARAHRDLGVSTTEAPVPCLPLIAPVWPRLATHTASIAGIWLMA